MLQKPKRGWWVVPGGKIEATETIKEAVVREFHEETNLKLDDPVLKGIFNIIIMEEEEIIEEWMMFTFYATNYTGTLTPHCEEGNLAWKNLHEVLPLPKAEGDNVYLKNILNGNELISGKFVYTPNYELISYKMDYEMDKIGSLI